MNIKNLIASNINFEGLDANSLLMESVSPDKGDYCLPCFSLSKTLHQSPQVIAEQVKQSIKTNTIIESVEVVGGYVNIFLNKIEISKLILTNFNKSNLKLNIGNGQVACLDYCSPNLAKYLHIGHLKTTIIGESLARIFTQCGYKVKRLNFVGDYGTPFGKIIGGMFKWGSLEDVKKRGNDALQEYYVKFNAEESLDPTLSQYARDIFKKIEDKDETICPIYKQILEIALKDLDKMLKILGVQFDDFRGEMHYNFNTAEIVQQLAQKNLLTTSEDAKIVDLNSYDMPPALILKSDGTTLYITRDIAAAISRFNEYNFNHMLYVTDVAQSLHFKQLFKVLELMGYGFANSMEHVPYGRFSLPDGKISSRRGKQAVLVDLLDFALNKAKTVIKNRTFNIENPEDVANKVARAVLNFSVLKTERNKDCVFDIEKAFMFDGDTAPYMQYTYTRLVSILRKSPEIEEKADYSCFNNTAFYLIKSINNFTSTINTALNKRDPSIIANKLMDMCKTFNKYYVDTKIIDGNLATTKAKLQFVEALKTTLAVGFNLICIDTLEEM